MTTALGTEIDYWAMIRMIPFSQLVDSIAQLPAALQGLNLFTVGGDLVDGNRGMLEFSDLLKRPVDSFKYILGLCENQSVNVGGTIAYLDLPLTQLSPALATVALDVSGMPVIPVTTNRSSL